MYRRQCCAVERRRASINYRRFLQPKVCLLFRKQQRSIHSVTKPSIIETTNQYSRPNAPLGDNISVCSRPGRQPDRQWPDLAIAWPPREKARSAGGRREPTHGSTRRAALTGEPSPSAVSAAARRRSGGASDVSRRRSKALRDAPSSMARKPFKSRWWRAVDRQPYGFDHGLEGGDEAARYESEQSVGGAHSGIACWLKCSAPSQ